MSYQIEISVNLKKCKNLSEISNKIIEKAEQCQLMNYYKNYEHIGENRKVYRNHCIITLKFMEHDELLAEFIKYIKNMKNAKIESVGFDDFVFKLMYASKNYLNIMEKEFSENYINLKRKSKLYKQDSIIYKILSKKY
jgi:hypothetical protein